MTASSESRHPWLRRPTRERRSYSTKPSPSGSPGPSIQASAASTAPARSSNPSRSPVHTASSATSNSQSAVESTEPKYGVCGTARRAASSPRRSSCMILPGCSSRKALSTVPWWRARNETADRPQRWSRSSVSRPTNAISRPNGAMNHGRPASGTRSPLTTVESSRRSSCPRRRARFSWSLSVKMSVDSDSQRSCSWRSAPMRALNSPPASPGASGPTTWTSYLMTARPPAGRCRRKRARPCLSDSGWSWKRMIVWRVTSSSPRYESVRAPSLVLGARREPRRRRRLPRTSNRSAKSASKCRSTTSSTSRWW